MNDKKDNQGMSRAWHKQHHTSEHQALLGEQIADMLNIKPAKNGLYCTAWGTKTSLGLYLSIKRILNDGGGQ